MHDRPIRIEEALTSPNHSSTTRGKHSTAPRVSHSVSSASAMFLGAAGIALIFGADSIMPALVPGLPREAAWIGELLGAAWFGVAALNWFSRAMVLGGIYGRPIVLTNAGLYLISAMTLLRVVTREGAPFALWGATVPMVVFAIAYGWLMLRGPAAGDVA